MSQRRIIEIDPRKLKLLERNARFMRHEQFQQLITNIKRDGVLDSVPLACWAGPESAGMEDDDPEKFIVLSGNHRTRASIEADLATINVMVIDAVLDPSEFIAKQLSHNAIAGEDDPATLKALYEEIEDVDWRVYAGLDDKTLGMLSDVQISSLSEANLDFQAVTIAFLPNEIEKAHEAFLKAKEMTSGDELWLTRWRDYDDLLDALEATGGAYGVKNVATQLMLILKVFWSHADDLSEGWFRENEEEIKAGDRVPLSAVFGLSTIPVSVAAKFKRELDRRRSQGEEVTPVALLEELLNE